MTFTLTAARAKLGELINRAVYGHEPIIITEHGRAVAAIISVHELAALRAAADAVDHATPDQAEPILASHADLLAQVAQAQHLLDD